jgi:DNA-binding transcriptional MerR regulator
MKVMMSIGEFARLGGVSVRMLRHYDAIGLLPPARVDDQTGHRTYDLSQLALLNRIVALKGLGFTLEEVAHLLCEGVELAELHAMLRLRQSQLERELHLARHRLNRVAARIHIIEREKIMSNTVNIKQVSGYRLIARSELAPDPSRKSVGPLIKRLFTELADRLDEIGGDRTTPIARYTPVSESVPEVRVTTGYVWLEGSVPDLEICELPEVKVATTLHRGIMSSISGAYQELAGWAQEQGYERCLKAGCWREVFIEADNEDQREWLVEVQLELS